MSHTVKVVSPQIHSPRNVETHPKLFTFRIRPSKETSEGKPFGDSKLGKVNHIGEHERAVGGKNTRQLEIPKYVHLYHPNAVHLCDVLRGK